MSGARRRPRRRSGSRGRRRRAPAGGGRVRGRLPRAGALAGPRRVSRARSPTGSCRPRSSGRPTRTCGGARPTTRSTSDDVRHRAADVQRRRGLDDPLRGRLAPHDAVGLPRQDARRRRRRLAADVRGARALLRPHRARGRRRRGWRAIRPTRREPTCRCRRSRSATGSSTSCGRTTGSAGTGGRRRTRSSPRRTGVAIRARSGARACRAAPRARRRRPTSRTGREAIERGARVVTGARVTRIVIGPRRPRQRRRVRRRGRAPMHVAEADVVVLAANAIGTARLLLAVGEREFPDGLANSSGLVGRRLMMHPFAVVTGVFERFIETWRGNVGSRIHCLEFYETDASRGFVRGAKWSMAPSTGGPMNAAMPARAGEAVWGDGAPPPRQGALRPLPELGDLRRGPARRAQPGGARRGARRRRRPAGAEDRVRGRPRTRAGCSTSTSSAPASRCSRRAPRASTR